MGRSVCFKLFEHPGRYDAMDTQNPFNAIKVVECGEGVSAAFGTKLR